MPREISPIPSSGSGDVITVPFPDLAKPEDGEWDLNVTLYDDTPGSSRAKIRLLQMDDQINTLVLGETTVMLTGSPTTYNVPVSGGSVSDVTDGRCHLSRLFLEITKTPCRCCCNQDLPNTLTASVSCEDCAALNGLTVSMTFNSTLEVYEGETTTTGGVIVRVVMAATTNNGVPYCPMALNYRDPNNPSCEASTDVGTDVLECDPFFASRETSIQLLECLNCGPATSAQVMIEIT